MNNYERARQLTDDLTQTRNDQFGEGTYGCPNVFFNPSVYTAAPDGRLTPRNAKYCATNRGATAIAHVFEESFGGLGYSVGITLKAANAFSGWGDEENPLSAHGWTDTEAVPYVTFYATAADGSKKAVASLNAGLMLDLFNHGYPVVTPLNMLAQELKDALKLDNLPAF